MAGRDRRWEMESTWTMPPKLKPGDTLFANVRCVVVRDDIDGYGVARVRPAFPYYDIDFVSDHKGLPGGEWTSVDEMTEDFV
jgi:hypothetical protein